MLKILAILELWDWILADSKMIYSSVFNPLLLRLFLDHDIIIYF